MGNPLPNDRLVDGPALPAPRDWRRPDQPPVKTGNQLHPSSSRRSRKYTSKHVLFNEGEDANTVYEVIDGTVMLYTISEDGRRTVLGFMQKGDYFGFVMHETHAYFAQTTGTCVVRSIPRNKLWHEIREHHRAAEKFLALESNALENARNHMVLLTRKVPIERVAVFLLEMSHRQGIKGDFAASVRLPMTRADIADYLGLVVETVCRCLTHLKEDGAIGKETRGQIEIVDIGMLKRYALGQCGCSFPDELATPETVNSTVTTLDTWTGLVDSMQSNLVAF